MTFLNAMKVGLDNYANFSGRSSRSEFWWFWLGCFLFELVFLTITTIIGFLLSGISGGIMGYSIGGLMCFVLMFLPMLAVSVRRLHDTNHSGWWYLIVCVPIIGIIWFIILMAKDSDEKNRYGIPTY